MRERPLDNAFSRPRLQGVDPLLFNKRLVEGASRLFKDPYILVGRFDLFNSAHFELVYRYGELLEREKEFTPAAFQAVESFLNKNLGTKEAVESLSRDNNLRYFTRTIDAFCAGETAAGKSDPAETMERNEQALSLLDFDLRAFLKDQELITANSTRARQAVALLEKRREEAKEEERIFEKKLEAKKQEAKRAEKKLLEKLIGTGRVLQAIEAQRMGEFIGVLKAAEMDNDKYLVAIAAASCNAKEALSLIIETIAHLTESPAADYRPSYGFAIEMAAQVLKANLSNTAALLQMLETAHLGSSDPARKEELKIKSEALLHILFHVPEAAYYCVGRYSHNYAALSPLARLASWLGIPLRNVNTRVYEPIINRSMADPVAAGHILRFLYDTAHSIRFLEETPAQQAKRMREVLPGGLGREVTARLVENIARQDRPFPSFAPKDVVEELNEIVAHIAKANDLDQPTRKQGQAVLLAAIKMQKLTELIRKYSKLGEARQPEIQQAAMKLYEELVAASANLILPALRSMQYFVPKAPYDVEDDLSYRVPAGITGLNFVSAQRALDALKEHPELYAQIHTLYPKHGHAEGDPQKNLPTLRSFIKYAYCFLTSDKPDMAESNRRDLMAALQEDPDGHQLFMTLQHIPPAIKEELLDRFKKMLVNLGYEALAAKLAEKEPASPA